MVRSLYPGLLLGFVVLCAAPAAADMAIAVVGPMTGPAAAFGAQYRNGAMQAVADINAAGGIAGEHVTLEVADDACEPGQAVAVANELAEQGVKFVVGHGCSASSIAASAVYADEGVVQIAPGSTAPAYTDARPADFIARMCGRDDKQGAFAGTWLARHYADKRIAILHDKSAYGRGIAEETRKALDDSRVHETMYEAYNAGEKDYTALVSKMKRAGIEAVYIGGYPNEAALIVRQMREQGLGAQMIGSDSMASGDFWPIAGAAGDGVLFTSEPEANKLASAAGAVARMADNGVSAEGITLYSYAAVQVYKQAVEAADSSKPEDVAAAMKHMTFDTVLGPVSFDSKGDPKWSDFSWYAWKDGRYARQ